MRKAIKLVSLVSAALAVLARVEPPDPLAMTSLGLAVVFVLVLRRRRQLVPALARG